MARRGEAELIVTPHANDKEALAGLSHAIVRRINDLPVNRIAESLQLSNEARKNPASDSVTILCCHDPLYLLNQDRLRFELLRKPHHLK